MGNSDENRFSIYLQYRSQLVEGLFKGSDLYDSTLLSLSSGALLLSIAFITDIAQEPVLLYLLKTSWVFFVLTIFFVLASFKTSQAALYESITKEDDFYNSGFKNWEAGKSIPHKTTELLNYVSGISFFIAVILTIVFAIKNL